MERGAPTVQAPAEELLAFFHTYQSELLWQSLFFVLSAGVVIWFYGTMRDVLAHAEGGTGRVAMIAFTAGVIGSILQFVMQSVQVTLALSAGPEMDPTTTVALGRFSFVLTVVAYLPASVLYAAVAVVTLRHAALPRSLGWFSAFTSAFHAVMVLGLVARSGPLVPGEPLTYAMYLCALIWLPWTVTALLRS